ncbi:MAG: Sua5/YciO/YrdC/YwlC family protein [Phycisphaerales bacterium JB040]
MDRHAARLSDLSPTQRRDALAHAARAIDDGGAVVFPTETVYGVGVSARHHGAFATLTGLAPPLVWHAHGLDPIGDLLVLDAPVARRLVRTLTPGPVQLVLQQPPETLRAIDDRLGLECGVIHDGDALHVRLPDHPVASEFLGACTHPVVATRVSAAPFADADADRLGTVLDSAGPGPDAMLIDAPAPYGVTSTALRIDLDGAFRVVREGVVPEREIMARLQRHVLFVCTGNTCRSPMAAAIARALVDAAPPSGITTTVSSAGVAAIDGMPASPEAVEAMADRGLDLSGHASRALTARLIAEADAVFTMTPSHAEAAMRIAPEAAHKIYPLDPRGLVPDPIGHPLEEYRRTADRLEQLITQRLSELDQ